MNRKLFLLILVSIAALLLSSCQPETIIETVVVEKEGETIVETVEVEKEVVVTKEVEVEVIPEDEVTELHVFHFKVNLQTEWQNFTDEYSAMNPDVAFVNEIIGGGSQWLPILKAKFAAGHGPDIFIVEGPAQAELFADFLTDLSGEPWVERAVPFAREGLRIDGKIMGMPVNLEGYGYIYNKAIFEEAGVTERPRTLEELQAAAEKIEAAGYTAFGTGYGEWWVNGLHLMNIPFARQEDPQAFMDAVWAGEQTMAGTPEFVALQQLIDLNVANGEDNPLTTDNRKQVEMFVNEEVAMIQQGNWKEKDILEADPDMEIGLLPMPLSNDPEAADKIAVGVPFYFVVNADSSPREQEEALEFLNFLVSSDLGKQYLVEKFKMIPAYGDIEPTGLGGISQDILTYSAEDKAIPWMFGQFPDGSPNEMSDAIQSYVAGQQDWPATLEMMDEIWARLSE